MINYIKGNLFSAPTGSVLAHACNCHGIWGGGIAATFRSKFPHAYEEYRNHCLAVPPAERARLVGTSLLLKDSGYYIACLFTSESGGESSSAIARATRYSMDDLVRRLEKEGVDVARQPVCMPRINSGIFGVPWDKTAEALEQLSPAVKIIVYDI